MKLLMAKKRVSSERILPTVCAQKALLQPGFSGVETRQELLHSHLPPVWLPWASSHLLLCPRETGGEQPPCPRRSEAPSLTRGPHSAPPRGPLLPASALSAALLWSLRGGGRSLSHTPPRRSSSQLQLPGRTGRACAGESRPETYKSAPRGSGLPLCSTPTTLGPQGAARASPRRPTSPQQARGQPSWETPGPRPLGARALQPRNPSRRPHPALRTRDHGRSRSRPRHQRTALEAPPPRSRTHARTGTRPSWVLPAPVQWEFT